MNHNTHNEPEAAARHWHYSPHSRLTLPVVSLVAIIAACSASYAWLSGVDARVEKNTRDIDELRREWSSMRERLIRIDENVKLLREELATMRKEGR